MTGSAVAVAPAGTGATLTITEDDESVLDVVSEAAKLAPFEEEFPEGMLLVPPEEEFWLFPLAVDEVEPEEKVGVVPSLLAVLELPPPPVLLAPLPLVFPPLVPLFPPLLPLLPLPPLLPPLEPPPLEPPPPEPPPEPPGGSDVDTGGAGVVDEAVLVSLLGLESPISAVTSGFNTGIEGSENGRSISPGVLFLTSKASRRARWLRARATFMSQD